MGKYIDRAALFNRLTNAKTVAEVFAAIQDAPAADVTEVVRCKDCVNYKRSNVWICGWHNNCELLGGNWDENAYCSYGEAKHG